MKKEVYRAETRGGTDHGWLKTKHSFSFADYYDPARMGFGALRVLNDDQIAPASGFGKHPHSNMEIITIPLEGAVTHEDSMGNLGIVKTGEVQIMSAGSGVVHSEENKDPEQWLRLFQIWIETDPRYKDIEPRYKQKEFSAGERENNWQLLASPPGQSELDIMQEAWICRTKLETRNLKLGYKPKDSAHGVYIMVIDGMIRIEDEKLVTRDAIALSRIKEIEITVERESDLLLIEVPL